MSDRYINGMGPGIQIVHHDEQGVPTSMSFVIEPCANEPPETLARQIASSEYVPWTHGVASWVFDGGATLLCGPCGQARNAETARDARLRRLPPVHRRWLAERGVNDWPV